MSENIEKPSPGPWYWKEYDEGWELFSGDNPSSIMQIYSSHGGGWEPNEADRKRIASVPDMEAEIVELRARVDELERAQDDAEWIARTT